MWFYLALLSAATVALRRLRDKRMTADYSNFTLGWLAQALSLPVVCGILIFSGHYTSPLGLGSDFWMPTLIVCVFFYPLNTFFYLQAIKHGELSRVIPIMSLQPLAIMLTGQLMLSETPSRGSILSIACVVLGVYVLHLKQRKLHNPLRPFLEERHSLYMLLSVLCIAVCAVLDKQAIQASNAVLYSAITTVGGVISLYITARLAKEPRLRLVANDLKQLLVQGTLGGISSTTYLAALGLGPIAYVSAVRGSSVLITSVFGIVFLKETLTRPKLAAFLLIGFGSVVLAYSA